MNLPRAFLSSGPKIARIPNRSVLAVSGSQASSFLDGVLSSSLPERGHSFSAFLNAQGRVLYDVFLYHAADSQQYLLEFDSRPSQAPQLLTLLKRYILRSKVKVRDVSEEYDVWAAWGSELAWETTRNWQWAQSGACEPLWNSEDGSPWGSEQGIIRDRRAVGMGNRLLVRKGDKPKHAQDHDLGTEDAYTIHRIVHGVPEGPIDIPGGEAFPMDSNLDIMGAVDFRKGCYVGQELTVRTYHTGVVRKRILPIAIHDTTQSFPAGLVIRAKPNEGSTIPKPRGTGTLLTSIQGFALALLRLDHIEGCHKGDLSMHFEDSTRKLWTFTHWWPEWWPQRPNSVQ